MMESVTDTPSAAKEVTVYSNDRGDSVVKSGKIDEVFQVADRVSVLRDGRYIGTSDIQELDHDTCIWECALHWRASC